MIDEPKTRGPACINCGLIKDAHNDHGDCPPIHRSTKFETAIFMTDPYKGFIATAVRSDSGDAVVMITRDGKEFRKFKYPTYKIWNIQAHFTNIVDGILEDSDSGFRLAGWTGFGGCVMPEDVK